jgi:hypothetical protein
MKTDKKIDRKTMIYSIYITIFLIISILSFYYDITTDNIFFLRIIAMIYTGLFIAGVIHSIIKDISK